MEALTWYGLRRREAERLCEDMGLRAEFAVTMDPKASASEPNAQGVPRVIRATETAGGMAFLLGLFAAGIEERA